MVRSHTRTDPSKLAVTAWGRLSICATATDKTALVGLSWRTWSPVVRSHTRTDRSKLAVTAWGPQTH
ncbi:hypothetical protein ACQKH3_17665, partial [Streptomyces niveus]|uniref:hypothetical protein n=1 Tax=Streptomyces niveus TaxID=193462 RepID=UPI003D01042B